MFFVGVRTSPQPTDSHGLFRIDREIHVFFRGWADVHSGHAVFRGAVPQRHADERGKASKTSRSLAAANRSHIMASPLAAVADDATVEIDVPREARIPRIGSRRPVKGRLGCRGKYRVNRRIDSATINQGASSLIVGMRQSV